MNKLFLWIAAASAFVLQSCENTDGIRDEIGSLRDRVIALEAKIGSVNTSIVALHKLMDESTIIVGIEPNAKGYEIELSDGTRLPVILGEKIEALVPVICEKAVAYAIASVDEKEIDATDILSARMKAMQLAIDALQIPADYALIDGNRDHGASAKITTTHETIVGGDGASLSIAAASVLAKVSRDHYVVEVLDPMYPEYQFARHKGYGTKLHYQMLDQYGPSPVHRMTFLKKWEARR